MIDYGVDITKAWETASQQNYALERSYLRGRQDERDRFYELKKECNNGWIPPEDDSVCIVTVEYPNNETVVKYHCLAATSTSV